MTTKIIGLVIIIWLTACQRQNSLTVNLKNYSKDNSTVNLKVVMGGIVIYNDKLIYNPDSNVFITIVKDLPDGIFSINASADSLINNTNTIVVDQDRIVNIFYYYNSTDTITETLPYQSDSVTIKRASTKLEALLDIILLHDK